MPSDLLYTATGGYECDLAAVAGGWALAAVSLADVDGAFVRNMDLDKEWEYGKALLYEGVTREDWNRAFVSLRARLDLIESRSGRIETVHEVAAEQFSGVAVAGGEEPAYAWCSLDGGRWSASVHHRGETRVVHPGEGVVMSPSLARDGDGSLWSAWVVRGDRGDEIRISVAGRREGLRVQGRYPSLAPVGDGIGVCFERFAGGESHIYFAMISDGVIGEPVRVSSRQPLNFLPRCIPGGDGGLLLVWESSPAWGFDIRVDQVRSIELKRVDASSGTVSDGPGTEQGVLPIPLRSYGRSAARGQSINMTPSNPRLVHAGGGLVCTFRMFEPDLTQRGAYVVDGGLNKELELLTRREGWHLCVTRWDGRTWSPPERVSNVIGFAHHPYGVADSAGGLVVAGHTMTSHQAPPRDSRVEVLAVDGTLARMHDGVPTYGPQPVHTANPVSSAPALPGAPEGMHLVFGDLHDHTSHSPCAPAIDGGPLDNIRLQRDVMGNEVLCIADHQNISDQDYRLRLDLLEREEGKGRVPLYALEWSKPPWQHTNFYTYDKEVMKHVRQILLGHHDLNLVFSEIADRFLGKVTAMRHYHDYASIGGHGEVGDTHVFFYDPRVEWAMEVLRGRGDAMATEEGMFSGPSDFPFPVNFIEWRGAKLGLIGASDHHQTKLGACVTGFWVSETNGEAVFDAVRSRRTIACANGKMSMWVRSGDVGMGSVGKTGRPIRITVSAAAPLPLERVSLWCDGRWTQHAAVERGQTEITFVDEESGPGEHYYIVRAQTEQPPAYPKGPIIGYASPLWLTVA